MIDQILVDLDDVCNHFTMFVLNHLGCSHHEEDFPVEVGYDIVAAYNIMKPDNISVGEFWSKVTPNIWSWMPRRVDTDWLLDLCARYVGRENVLICTKSLGHPLHYAHKIQWMQANLPSWIQNQFSITSRKEAYACPTTLLIDDSADNVDKFRARKGGKAILVPRPWNRNNRLNSHTHIEFSLDCLFTNDSFGISNG